MSNPLVGLRSRAYRGFWNFKFNFTPPDKVTGAGRRAENVLRYESSNYDEMLQAAGGLLYPEQYQVLREGVDRIVKSYQRTGGTHV